MRRKISALPAGWVDAHTHLADLRIGDRLGEVLARSRAAGVAAWIQGGYDPADWDRQSELAKSEPASFFPSYGLHPWWVSEHSDAECDEALKRLETKLSDGLAVGLGELGLDFGEKRLHSGSDSSETVRERQTRVFEAQLGLANEREFPLVLHVVRAHEAAVEILKRIGVPEAGGIVHSFSGNQEAARSYLQLGLRISVSGAVTRKGFESLKKAVVLVPAESLIIETDSPDQAPMGFEGALGVNEPASLMRVAQAVGQLRGEAAETVLARSRENVLRVFGV